MHGPRPIDRFLTPARLLAAAIALTAGAQAMGRQTPASPVDPFSQGLPDALRVLQSADASPESRRSAANELIARMTDRSAEVALERALSADDPAGSRSAVLEAMALLPSVPARLASPAVLALRDLHARANEQGTILALAALGRVSTLETAETVLDIALGERSAAAVRQAAFDSLVAQTGRTDLDHDPEAWRRWWDQVRWMSREQYTVIVLDSQRAAAAAARAAATELQSRLLATHRKLYAQSTEEQRSAQIAEMLTDPMVSVRELGFELVMVGLLNAKPVSSAVAAAAMSRLADPVAKLRAEAARVVRLSDGNDFDQPLLEATRRETDPAAAAAMLRASAKRGLEGLQDVAVRWLSSGSSNAADAAARYLLDGKDRSFVDSAQVRSSIIAAIERLDARSMTPVFLELAVRVDQSARVAALLDADDPAMATAAASALASDERGLEPLLAAAARQPRFFDQAIDALQRFRPTAQGLTLAASLPAPDADRRTQALQRLADALPVSELRRAIDPGMPAADRASWLARAGRAEFYAESKDLTDRVEAALLLARTRAELGQPGEALDVIELLPSDWQGPRAQGLRASMLLCLDRFDEADVVLAGTAAPPDPSLIEMRIEAWLDALLYCGEAAHASKLREGLLIRYEGLMNPAQQLRFDQLSEKALGRTR